MVWYGALCHAVHQHIGVVAFPALLMAEHRKTSKRSCTVALMAGCHGQAFPVRHDES